MQERRVRWGLVGTARINERLIPCLRQSPRSELRAVASRKPETANAFAAVWDIPHAYGSYETLLNDSEIDAVYVSLPNHLHADWAVKFAEAGKHVLCEKPLALTTTEVERIMQAAERSHVIIQEAAMMRFHQQVEFVRDLIAQGTIGELCIARSLFTFMLERAQDIRWDPSMGGGSLWDLGSYPVRWFRTVFAAEPHEVVATQITGPSSVDTSFSGELHFANGSIAHFFSSFAGFAHSETDIIGSRGRMTLDMPWSNLLNTPSHVRWTHVVGERVIGTFGDKVDNVQYGEHTFEKVNAYQDEVDSMVSSILDSTPPKIPLTDSYNNTAVINALYESARVRRPVTVNSI